MPALIIAAADAIQREIETQLENTDKTYKTLSLDEKLSLYINHAAEGMASTLGTDFSRLRPYITDFISCGASIYEPHHTMDAVKRASHLGLSGIELHSVDLGGASIPAALEIARRLCQDEPRVVLIAGAETPRSNAVGSRYFREVNDALLHKELELHTQANLISIYALFADRLMFEHNLTQKHIDDITTYYRNCAQKNDRATTQGKLLKEGELARYLAGPYATPMVAVATDHGVAILVVNDAYLRMLKEKLGITPRLQPLYITSVGTSFKNKYVSLRQDFSTAARSASARAFERGDIVPADIDYAWVYDCFTLMLVKQAARYFELDFKEVAVSLAQGFVQIGDKRIMVNESGGILNTQAAISLSAATGLLDILSHAEKHPDAQNFLFGGNGGLDTVNSVALLTRTPRDSHASTLHAPVDSAIPLPARPLQEDETLVLYAAVMIKFNPGTDTPCALGAFRRADGTLCLARIYDSAKHNLRETTSLKHDQTRATIQFINEKPTAVLTL